MENATKALMIAGAVLIAIMVISVGMMIFSSGNEAITGSLGQVNQLEIDQFNSKFLAYEGPIKGSRVKSLISDVITSNSTNTGINDERLIAFDGIDPTSETWNDDLVAKRKAVVSGKTYEITVKTDKSTGYVTTIEIDPTIDTKNKE